MREQDKQGQVEDIESRQAGVYHATPAELRAIDEAFGQLACGEIASREDIEAAFAKFRGQ